MYTLQKLNKVTKPLQNKIMALGQTFSQQLFILLMTFQQLTWIYKSYFLASFPQKKSVDLNLPKCK